MEIGSLEIVHALRRASGHAPAIDDAASLAARISDDPGNLNAVADQIRHEAWLALVQGAVPDHSQCGEFKLLLHALVARAASPGIVVDVGACDRSGSNSYDLVASFGWRGLLIEAYPDRASKLHAEFGDGHYQVIECAVGLSPGRQPFWLGAGDMINSLDRSGADQFGGQGKWIEVEVRRLEDILSGSGIPHDFDLLSIDIEGLDIAVFNDFIETSPYRPRHVVIEAMHGWTLPLETIGFSRAVIDAYRELGRTLPNVLLEKI